ncbi:MAG: Ig-like domain-containing protein [Gemmatimonas sp.]
MAFSRRIVAIATLLAAFGGATACDALKKVKDACSVEIAPRDLSVPVNASTNVIGTAFDCDGNSIRNKTIKYSSANPAIASVTDAGVVIGIATGTTKISASANGKNAEANVTVTPERVSSITVTPTTQTLRRGNSLQMTAVAKNAQGNVINGVTFAWASSNSSLASVDNAGRVLALAPGQVTITATADGQTGSSLLTITEVPIGSCSLTPATQKITVGGQGAPTLVLRDTAQNVLSQTGRAISWSSDNNLVATVSGAGVISAVKAGTAKITAADQTNPAVRCEMTDEGVLARIGSAHITPVNANLRLGAQRQYTVQLLDSNSQAISAVGRTVTWKNPTPTIATVSPTGLVVPVSVTPNGPVVAGRIAVDAEGVVDTANFTVSKIPVTTVVVSPLQQQAVEGATAQFTAVVTDSANNTVTDRSIQWLSSDITKAQVSTTGLVTAIAAGQITITANVEGRTGTGTLVITQIPVDTILVTSTTYSVTRGTAGSISIDLRDAQNRQLRNRSVIITSDQPSIATGSANPAATQVNITASTVGTTTLTIQAVNSNGQNEGKPSRVTVTVTAPP